MHKLLWAKKTIILPIRAFVRVCNFPRDCACNSMGLRSDTNIQASNICTYGCCMGSFNPTSSFGSRRREVWRWKWLQNRWVVLHFTRYSSGCNTWDISCCWCAGWIYGFPFWIYFACLHINARHTCTLHSKFHQWVVYISSSRGCCTKAKLRWDWQSFETHGCWQCLYKTVTPNWARKEKILTRSNTEISIWAQSRLDAQYFLRLDRLPHREGPLPSKPFDLVRIFGNQQWRYAEYLDRNILESCRYLLGKDKRLQRYPR